MRFALAHLTPTAEGRSDTETKRSRFIGVAMPARSAEEAAAALEALRTEFPDATHHCFAYVIGDPNASPEMRWDDDGEPGGTAGRPILNVLTQRRAGDVLTVVVRYFGGVKLGAGGLVRAYSAAASAALDEAGLTEAVSYAEVTLRASYADEKNVRHLLEGEGVSLVTVDYADDVAVTVRVPRDKVESLHRALSDRTQGRVKLI